MSESVDCGIFRTHPVRAAIRIGVRCVENTAEQRAEVLALNGLACRQRQGTESPPMKAAVEGDELISPRMIAGEFHPRLERFGTGISEVNPLRSFARRNGGELLGQVDHAFVVKVRARHVDEVASLLPNGGDHFRMAM